MKTGEFAVIGSDKINWAILLFHANKYTLANVILHISNACVVRNMNEEISHHFSTAWHVAITYRHKLL